MFDSTNNLKAIGDILYLHIYNKKDWYDLTGTHRRKTFTSAPL